MDFTAKTAQPAKTWLVQAQVELWQQYMKLWRTTAQAHDGPDGRAGGGARAR